MHEDKRDQVHFQGCVVLVTTSPASLRAVEETEVRDHLSYFTEGLRTSHAYSSSESEPRTWNQKTWIWILACPRISSSVISVTAFLPPQ